MKWHTGKIIRTVLVVLAVLLHTGHIAAQQFSVQQSLDTNQILPGERVRLNIHLQYQGEGRIQFPALADSLPKGLEMTAFSLADSSSRNGVSAKNYVALLTAFDSGSYVIPPLHYVFVQGNAADTLTTIPLLLSVQPVKVDMQKDIFDVKPPLPAPWTLAEILFWTGLFIFLSMFITICWLLIKRRLRKQPVLQRIKPAEPVDVLALRSLDLLKEEKLWQQGRVKEYYTRLTEIVRLYIEQRFEVPALEQPSSEILESLRFTAHEDESTFAALKQLLELADLVKFAKALPMPDDNEGNLLNAYVFVNRTKLVAEPVVIKNEENASEN